MKKLFTLALCLCLLLWGCQNVPAQSTKPETVPTETDDQKSVTLGIGFPMECTITNAEGQKITVSDREVQGDMEILELSLPPERTEVVYDGCPMYSITVPYSESFTFDIEKIGYRGIFSASNCSVGFEGTNISNVILHSSDKASITGKNMHLWLSTGYYDNWTCDVDIQEQKAVTVQRLDTGMLVEGLEGDAVLRSRSVKEEVEYTFTGEAVEIDVVSQPEEILITPVEG